MASRTPSGPARDSEAVGRSLGSVTSTLFVLSLLCSLVLHPSIDAGLVSGYWKAMGCEDFSGPLWPLQHFPHPPARAVSFIPYQIRNSWRRGMALCEGDQGIGGADYGI